MLFRSAGGQLKGAEVDDLIAAHHNSMKAVVLLGQDRDMIAASLNKHAPKLAVEIIDDNDGEEAMRRSVEAAIQHAEAGDTVLLAPAAASLDMYSGMSERGDLFAHFARTLFQGEEL